MVTCKCGNNHKTNTDAIINCICGRRIVVTINKRTNEINVRFENV